MGGRQGKARVTATGVPAAGGTAVTQRPAPPLPAEVQRVLAERDAAARAEAARQAARAAQNRATAFRPVRSWTTEVTPAGARATPYRTERDARPGDVLGFPGAAGSRERFTVVGVSTIGGNPNAVTSVTVVHEREGKAEYRRTMPMADWQRVRDRHQRQFGTR